MSNTKDEPFTRLITKTIKLTSVECTLTQTHKAILFFEESNEWNTENHEDACLCFTFEWIRKTGKGHLCSITSGSTAYSGINVLVLELINHGIVALYTLQYCTVDNLISKFQRLPPQEGNAYYHSIQKPQISLDFDPQLVKSLEHRI